MDNGQGESNFGLTGSTSPGALATGQQQQDQGQGQTQGQTQTLVQPVAAPTTMGVGVVQSVTSAVASHPAVVPEHAPSIAATVLATLAQDLPAIFQLSGASPKTQAYTALGLGFVEAVLGAYLAKAQAQA